MHSSASSSSPARRLFPALALLASAALALPALVHAQTRYTITNLGSVAPVAINASGAIVASSAGQTVVYSGGSTTPVPGLSIPNIVVTGINASGSITGWSIGSNGLPTALLMVGGVLTNLGQGAATGINDAGTVAVYGSPSGAYLRSTSGVVTPLPAPSNGTLFTTGLNEAGTAAGYFFDTSFVRRAALATPAGMTLLDTRPVGGGLPSSGEISIANAINSAGVAVGFALVPGSGRRAVLFSGGSFTNLDPTGTVDSEAYAINSAGTVVGQRFNNNTGAFIYTAATGLVNLSTLVNNLAAAGFTSLTEARGINDAGQICGFGIVGGVGRAFRLDPAGAAPVAPAITTHPAAQTVAAGGSATFSVVATGSPAPTYEWRFNNTPIAGATAASYALAAVNAANAGSYTVRVFNTAGTVTSNAATLTVTAAPPATASRLTNLSILTTLSGANDSFTMGYVVGGRDTSGAKPLVIRAAGPSLSALNVTGALADPKLELFAGATKTGENDNWGGGADVAAAMLGVGAFAFTGPTSRDAAVALSTTARDNSAKVSPVGNLSGTVIAEVYDATPHAAFTAATPRLINVSVLKNIGTSLSAGFVIAGGTGSRTVLIRAIGPTLGSAFGLTGVVDDPRMELFTAGTKIGENDNWGGGAALNTAFTNTGAFLLPANSRDAALLVTLAPGNYSVVVTGANGASGTALVEVYEVP